MPLDAGTLSRVTTTLGAVTRETLRQKIAAGERPRCKQTHVAPAPRATISRARGKEVGSRDRRAR